MTHTKLTIAIVAPHEPFEFFDAFWEGVWSAVYELISLGVEFLSFPTGSPGIGEQGNILTDLLQQDIQGLVLFPAHPTKLDHLIQQHSEQGVRVVTAFSDAPRSQRVACVTQDSRMAGTLAGELLSRSLPPQSHIVALRGSVEAMESQPHLQLRYAGFREALSASGIPFALSEFTDPLPLLESLNLPGRSFDGLYLGCEELFDSKQILDHIRAPSRCVAFNLTEAARIRLRAGTVCAVVDSDIYYHGYLAVQKAYESLQSRSEQRSVVMIPSRVVIASNAGTRSNESSIASVFEALVRQRTCELTRYKEALGPIDLNALHAANDSPAGLLTEREFEQAVEAAMAGCRSSGKGTAILVMDLDGFRSFQGLLDREESEEILQQLAISIRAECRRDDAMTRIGEEQFAILLTGLNEEEAEAAQRRMLNAISETRIPSGVGPDASWVTLRVGAGIAFWNESFRTAADLISEGCHDLQSSRFSRLVLRGEELTPV